MQHSFVFTATFLAALATALPLQAQYDRLTNSAVTGTGTIEIERMPEKMRVQVAVLSKAGSLKEALANLKTRVDAARKKVVTLGAKADSIKVEPARVSSEKTDRQKQMEAMVASRMRGKGKKGGKSSKSQPVTVSASMTAEFPLTGKDHEALLIEAQNLQDTIKAADLAGREAATKLTAEEQELQEEMNDPSTGMSYGGEEEAKPGDPMFLFVCVIPVEEREKAMAAAFKKAHADADQLAKAAGRGLGAMTYLSSNANSSSDSDDETPYAGNSAYRYRMALQMMRGTGTTAKKDDTFEAIGSVPGLVKCTVVISVGYSVGAGR